MNFFQLSTGEQAGNTGEFNLGGGDFEPIPNDTQVKAYCEESKWDEYQGDRYINLKWEIIEGEFKGRKIFQKLKVADQDSKKRDKAISMLAAIDTNSGGGLMRIGREPNDMELQQNLCNKPMALLLKVWSIKDEATGETKKGNWVGAVAPLNRRNASAPQPSQQPAQQTNVQNDMPDW